MKNIRINKESLSSLNPKQIWKYLSNHGWQEVREKPGFYAIFVSPSSDSESCDIFLPLNPHFDDFSLRMYSVLETISTVEKKPVEDVYMELVCDSFDVVRYRIPSDEDLFGSLPIKTAVDFFGNIKEMLIAAACSTVEPRPYYPSNKPKQVDGFLDMIKIGQSEYGSYIIPVISPLNFDENPQTHISSSDPFERQVVKNLANALNILNLKTNEYFNSDDITIFDQTISFGVNANLCDAIVKMGDSISHDGGFEIQFFWSDSLPLEEQLPNIIEIKKSYIPIISKVSEYLKEYEPKDDFNFVGVVIKLERHENSPVGKVTVQGLVNSESRQIIIELTEREYQIAIRAHKGDLPVECSGTLIKTGRMFRIMNCRKFKIWEEDARSNLSFYS